MRPGPKPLIDEEAFRPRTDDEVWALTRALVERAGLGAAKAYTLARLLREVPVSGRTASQQVQLSQGRPYLARLGEPPWGRDRVLASAKGVYHAAGARNRPRRWWRPAERAAA